MLVARILLALLAISLAGQASAAGTDPPLVAASTKGDLAAVEKLLNNGTDPNSHDASALTALNWAAYNGHLDVVKALVEHKAKVDSNANKYHWTPLMNAANQGHTDIVDYLLVHGADINAITTDKWTPLRFAEGQGKVDTATLLFSRGAKDDDPACNDQFCVDIRMLLFAISAKQLKRFQGAKLDDVWFQSKLVMPGARACKVKFDALICNFGTREKPADFNQVVTSIRSALPTGWNGAMEKDAGSFKEFGVGEKKGKHKLFLEAMEVFGVRDVQLSVMQ